ncbi:hypothetical protein NPIL_120761, partial [Nephila pilipes]
MTGTGREGEVGRDCPSQVGV